MAPLDKIEEAWVANRGAACTSAAVCSALLALGAQGPIDLGAATLALGARQPYGAPGLLNYVALPGQRPQLDVRIEALAAQYGLALASRTSWVIPLLPLRPRLPDLLIVNLAWGQEKPGRYGSWGWNPLRPASYSTGGHSVLLAAIQGRSWIVLDPNHRGLQRWPRPGLAVTATAIRLSDRGLA